MRSMDALHSAICRHTADSIYLLKQIRYNFAKAKFRYAFGKRIHRRYMHFPKALRKKSVRRTERILFYFNAGGETPPLHYIRKNFKKKGTCRGRFLCYFVVVREFQASNLLSKSANSFLSSSGRVLSSSNLE